jgi:hypothetical protein
MIYNLPLRLTILHFAQRLRMEGPTFMIAISLHQLFNQSLNYTCSMPIRPVDCVFCILVMGQSGREGRLR